MSAERLKTTTATSTDERQPLLQSTEDSNHAVVDMTSEGEVHRREFGEPETGKVEHLTWNWVAFYVVLFIGGLVALGLLIKGFIDAGDKDFDLAGALKMALGGGLSGAAAMVLQVLTLMPLRTIMNYQYRFGTSLSQATLTLYNDGGWTRYYHGLTAALFQGPLSRFGDTAANAGILALLESNAYMKTLPTLIKTVFASLAAAAFRIILTPIDTVKTTLQTQGKPGLRILKARIARYGIRTLWYGALATAAATFVGHYPWFGTYNYLEAHLPEAHSTLQNLSRRAFIGFVASIASDTISNSLRVVKTYRQVNETKIGYMAAARAVISVDGLRGLFGRGLKTRILANGLQGVMFSILWKFFLDLWNEKTKNEIVN
ncbi:mitochondrial carrier domain-containing protein [Crepidotus variabilis]|uniref:Mitochondrial carrier domain-containing protein n=1 Tax=Crepidotus variabilis TaxID=179855 RepID=A0A9P6E6A1_9AGAR|nr:mitochondrial carrier domain-containing protein [Crepidotus variabilis]